MIQRKLQTCLLTVFIFCMATSAARAEVTGFEVKSRTDVAGYNYEKVVGRIHFAVDPRNPHNAVIADLDKAQQDAAGKVVFSADLYIWKPKSGGSEVALVDIVNRGRLTFQGFSAVSGQDPVGDGFLVRRGLTVVAVGWEFDIAASDNLLRLDAPIATEGGKPITGMVSAMFVPDRPDPMVVRRFGWLQGDRSGKHGIGADGSRWPVEDCDSPTARSMDDLVEQYRHAERRISARPHVRDHIPGGQPTDRRIGLCGCP